MQKAVEVLRTAVGRQLQRRALSNVKGTDEALLQLRAEAPDLGLGDNIIVSASYVLAKAMARSKNLPLYKCKFSYE